MLIGNDNIFLSGPPGSGKSYLIEHYVDWARGKGMEVAVTASTGIAASLLGGITIHSWSGLTNAEREHIAMCSGNKFVVNRLKQAQVLIIDEISMISASYLDALDELLKTVRKNSLPFGGLKTVLCGDFYQLPPVDRRGHGNYAFLSQSWEAAGFKTCLLEEQHRQQLDKLNSLLTALRDRRFSKQYLDILTARQGLRMPETTMLLTHNSDVDRINMERLDGVSGNMHHYSMRFIGNQAACRSLAGGMLAPKDLFLKTGAKIMFTANDFSAGFVNGSQGVVIGLKGGLPVVELEADKRRVVVEVRSWKQEIEGKIVAEVCQLPLRLAWAITIHKSQGMSLDSTIIDLRRSFSYGMGYVALSRVRKYQGLYLLGYNSRSLELDPTVHQFYDSIKQPINGGSEMSAPL